MRLQHGAVLVTALFLMLAVLMIGVSAARTALNSEKSARHERDRHIAFNAAQAALLDAEHDVEGGADPASARAALFAPGSAGFVDGCGQGASGVSLGLCLPALGAAAPLWQTLDLAGADSKTVPYGRFTGAAMAVAGGILPARLPRYIIELVPLAGATPTDGTFYRITAIGFGSRAATRVVLQSFYRKPAPAPPAQQAAPTPVTPAAPPAGAADPVAPSDPPAPAPASDPAAPVAPAPAPAVPAALPTVPAGRISWREIANWPELHQATLI